MKIELINPTNITTILPLLQELDETIPSVVLKQRLGEMVSQGYQCVGMYDDDKLVGICGIWIITKYYTGKHIEPDNLIILPEYRLQGWGNKLVDWVCEYGKTQGCIASELNCYLPNKKGQQFWRYQGFEVIGYHFTKAL